MRLQYKEICNPISQNWLLVKNHHWK